MTLVHHTTQANARRHYRCLRLYNANGHFIKQFLFEPELSDWLISCLKG